MSLVESGDDGGQCGWRLADASLTAWQSLGGLRCCHCPVGLGALAAPARAVELSAPIAAAVQLGVDLSADREIDDGLLRLRLPAPRRFWILRAGDRAALTQIMAAGHASAAAERAAAQKAVIWFDRRMGPILGTNKRVAKADIRAMDDKHNFDCWDTTRNTTSLLLVLQQWGLFKYHVVGDPHYRGNALMLQTAAQHGGAGRSRDQGRVGSGYVAARLSAAT